MFNRKPDSNKTGLENAINSLLAEMAALSSETDEYATMADQLVKLYKLKEITSGSRVSNDVLVTAAAHILGIGMIVGHERTHVVASKALGFVSKLR